MCSCKGLAVVVLVIVNFVFAAAGLLMLAFGIAAAAKPESIVDMLSYTGNLSQMARNAGFDLASIIQSSSIFLIVMGAVVALVGLFGCVGACCKVKWMLRVYIAVLMIILLAEIALIIFAALFPEKFQAETQPAMLLTLQKITSDGSFNGTVFTMPPSQTDLAWASMQIEVGCCGANGYTDYKNISFTRTTQYPTATVPISCCVLTAGPGHIPTSIADFKDLNGCLANTPIISSINQIDCYTAVETLIKKTGHIGIGIAAAIIGVEIILILLSAWICRSIGNSKSQTI